MKKLLSKIIVIAPLMFFIIQASAQQPYSVTLRVDYNAEAKLYHDEPVVFTVSVTNKEAQENSRWNKAAGRRIKELDQLLADKKISRENYDKEKKNLSDGKKPISSVTVGSKSKPWSSMIVMKAVNKKNNAAISLPIKAMTNPSSEDVAVLGEKGNYISWFGIDPDDLEKIPAGEYKITVALNSESSEAVQVNILQENMNAAFAGSEFILLKEGQYYWHANDSKRAMQYVDMLLQKKPNSLEALSLKGDIQVLDKSYQPALETFNKAVQEYYKQSPGVSEPPEYFLEMIAWLKTQF